MRIHKQAAVSVAMATTLLLAACSSTPISTSVAATTVPTRQDAAPVNHLATQAAGQAVMAAVPLAPYLDPKNPLFKERSVYFDFDQSVVKPNAAQLVEMHGRYLAAHPDVSIKIEGNTDSQGGAEYNLALGQKRADAVLNSLKIFGAKDAQLEAVSFGMEKPKALGSDETAYAQNRRADLAYPLR
ncbi:OmpA family protein [Rhodoferax sp.]|uniref:OmpA family protein n=1 Tax=Rhodoferax sp. TaxID=50421 RepID=UPI0026357796|nr:OmpA family protein [Rhodoferax sp.]MDD2811230.1 OmpA family protein [Rhodoferax sp.]